MRREALTSSKGGAGFSSDTAGGSTVAAVENRRGGAGVFDRLVTRWWPGLAGRRSGEDERSDERGD